MEMMSPQIAAAASQTQTTSSNSSTSSSQASKSINVTGFNQVLINIISAETIEATASAQPVNLVANVVQTEVVAAEGTAVEPTVTDLMAVIDGLIEQLQGTVSEDGVLPVEDEQAIKDLEAALDQMTALLALLGVPVTIVQPTTTSIPEETGSEAVDLNVIVENLKSNLQDTLIQLEGLLQQGSLKQVQQQEPTVFVAQQLQALTALLNGESVEANKSQTKSNAANQQLFVAQNAPQEEASTFLHRLAQQVVNPSLLTSVTVAGEQSMDSDETQTAPEPISWNQFTASSSDSLKTLTPEIAKTAATSYVVADEFAESMSGLIVQKFDLSTVDGVSEAKIMLFPEHLGQVDVRISMQNGILTAVFQTDTAMAKDMLDNQMAQLRSALQAQGLMVDKLEVTQGQNAAQLSQQQQGQGSGQQQFTNNRQSFKGQNGSNDSLIETEVIEQAAVLGLGYGRGINVKA